MKTKIASLILLLATSIALMPTNVFAWGCSRSMSASGWRGSVSHSSSTSGGWGGYSHSGSTTVDGRYGNTYTASHSSSGSYYGGGYHCGGYGGVYHAGGCYAGGAFAAGAVTGAVVGATAASAAYDPYAPGVYYPAAAW